MSHTANDILTTLTGLYPDNHGQPVANTFAFYTPDGQTHTALSFAYWTDLAQAFDGTAEGRLNLVTQQRTGVPAPWVAFTRAGCNVGGVATANIELERTANVATVYGANSPEATEAADKSNAGQARTTADFIGIGVHCAKSAALCASANHGRPDLLPDEPGGYQGFAGLATARVTTAAMASGSATDDRRYVRVNREIQSIATERDGLASKMEAILEGAAFDGHRVDEDLVERLIAQSNALLKRGDSLELEE